MPKRTALDLPSVRYGKSVRGASLDYYPAKEKCQLLIIAGIHGEEPETTVALSRAVRSIAPGGIAPNISWIPSANPDGLSLGTRGNANGVDLNRNFPTANWQADPTTCRWHADEELELPILTGASPGSEPESRALISLIRELAPGIVLTLHGPLACVDDPDKTPLARWISDQAALPLVSDIGYPTPGSMGTWASERNIPWITWEFPPDGIETISRTQVPVLQKILEGQAPV